MVVNEDGMDNLQSKEFCNNEELGNLAMKEAK